MKKKALSSGNKRTSQKPVNRILIQAFICALLVLLLSSFTLLQTNGQPNPIYPNPRWGGNHSSRRQSSNMAYRRPHRS